MTTGNRGNGTGHGGNGSTSSSGDRERAELRRQIERLGQQPQARGDEKAYLARWLSEHGFPELAPLVDAILAELDHDNVADLQHAENQAAAREHRTAAQIGRWSQGYSPRGRANLLLYDPDRPDVPARSYDVEWHDRSEPPFIVVFETAMDWRGVGGTGG